LKKKLLSPTELKEFRLQQEEQRKLRAEQLQRQNRRLTPPQELFKKPVVEVVEEPVVEEVKEPIDLLGEKLNEEIAKLEILIANKVNLDEFNLEPINIRIVELKETISQLPEVKYYDDDLEKLTERVDQLQVSGSEIFQQHGENLKEIKKVIHQMLEDLVKLDKREIPEAFDPTDIQTDIAATKETFYERVAELKKELSELPEVKYYDDELTQLQERIEAVRDSIPEIPEIKYYDDDLDNLLGLIEEVRGNVSQLPEVKYYENEIAQLEESIKSVEDRIPTVPEVRYYEDDIEALREEIKNVEGQIPEVPEIPEIKYYDEEVEVLSEDIDKVRDSLIDIKLAIRAVEKSVEVVEGREIPEAFDPTGLQIEIEKAFHEIEKLKEQPVTVKEDVDPLVPLDQKFVTFDDLAEHYRTFIVRIQQQLMSLGGGGEVNLRYLDDIDRSSISDGKVLSYDAATKKFKFISPGAASSLWNEQGANIYRNSNVGINSANPQVALDVVGDVNVTGVITATSFTGSVTGDVSGTLTGEFVSNVDKTLEYQSGTLSTITTSEGTKTFYYDGAGILTSIVGTGVYVSKTFSYDGNGNLISVNVL